MKKITFTIIALLWISLVSAQGSNPINNHHRYWLNQSDFQEHYPDFRYWQIGIGLGEIPMHGSFKPSFTVGYHFNDKFYLGIIYQLKDNINRGTSSFNAKDTHLNGLIDSKEKVGPRFMLQGRFTPVKFAPYLSFGIVFNDQDRELMYFEQSDHTIGNNSYETDLIISQTRPAGWAPAIGLGYQFDFKRGFSINAEWTPGWFTKVKTPIIEIESTYPLDEDDIIAFKKETTANYKSHITNLYKVFHFGISYRY